MTEAEKSEYIYKRAPLNVALILAFGLAIDYIASPESPHKQTFSQQEMSIGVKTPKAP